MHRMYTLLGVAQAGGAAGAVLTLLRTESVQLFVIVGMGAIIVGLLRWTLGKLIKIASDKVDKWDEQFVSMDATLEDVPRRADFAALDRKVDELSVMTAMAGTRLDDHSGRLNSIEQNEHRLITRALGHVVDRLLKGEKED